MYLKGITNEDNREHVKEVINIASEIITRVTDEQLIFDAYLAICKIHITLYDKENSLIYAMKLLANASSRSNVKSKVQAFILYGKALEINDKKTDAFENYLNAQELIAQLHDGSEGEMQFDLDGKLFDFNLKINQFDKAVYYKTNQITYLADNHVDSNRLMWLKLDLCVLQLAKDKNANLKPQFEEIIDYSERNVNLRIFFSIISIYRTYLLNHADLKGFKELFVDRYPDNLEMLKKEQLPLYFIIKAYLKEEQQQIDSAQYYFNLAEIEALKKENDIYESNFYKRYGEFLLRNNNKSAALEKFKIAYQKAASKKYLDYMLETSDEIEELSLEIGDYKNAYQFGKIHNELLIRKSQAFYEDNLLQMELKSQARQKEIIAEKKEEDKRRKFNLQYAIIIIAIMLLFLLLILASSLTVPEWLIDMLGFFSILFLFEFIIILLDHRIHHATHGEPLKIFLIKIGILTFLFPFHHFVETKITDYMKKHKMIGSVGRISVRKALSVLWPWMTPNIKKQEH